MTLPRLSRFGGGLALACLALATPAMAADRHLDQNTILVFSSDNVAKCKEEYASSQYGAFMNEPSIQKLAEHAKKGVINFLTQAMAENTTPEQKAQVDRVVSVLTDYYNGLSNNVNGSLTFGLGYRDAGEGRLQPDFVLHFQGGDEFDALHERFISLVTELSEGEIIRTSREIGGVGFKGALFPDMPAEGPFVAPDGFWFGRKGNDYYVGISSAGLGAYVNAASGTFSGRFGNTSFFQQSAANGVTGNARMFVHLQPVWDLMPMILGMANPSEAQQIHGMIQQLGLTDLGGMSFSSQMSQAGSLSNMFVSLSQQRGLMKILFGARGPVTLPSFVPKEAMQAQAMRINYGAALGVIREIAGTVGGERALQEMDSGLAEMKAEIGVGLDEILSSLEGTTLVMGLPLAEGANPMQMMTDPSAAFGRIAIGLKLNDPSVVERLLATLSGHAATGGQMRVESFSGRQIYSIGPETPAEFGQMGPPTPVVSVDQGWVLVAFKKDDLKHAIRTTDGGADVQLASQPSYQAMLARAGGGGEMLAYQDQGKALGQNVDMMKSMLSMAAFFLPPEVFADPDLSYVLTPSNLPSNSLLQKYFGQAVSSGRMTESGMVMVNWAPNPLAPKPSSEK